MFKIALASHGSLCRGMRETARLFTQDVSFIQIFPFYEENPESDAEAQLDAWIQDIHEEDVVVMLTDILWGSVNQKIMLKLQNRTNVHIVTGLNLPLLLEMITMEPLVVSRIFSNTWIRFWKLQRSIPASGSSKIDNGADLARLVAISIRFSSPPDRLLFTSR